MVIKLKYSLYKKNIKNVHKNNNKLNKKDKIAKDKIKGKTLN